MIPTKIHYYINVKYINIYIYIIDKIKYYYKFDTKKKKNYLYKIIKM